MSEARISWRWKIRWLKSATLCASSVFFAFGLIGLEVPVFASSGKTDSYAAESSSDLELEESKQVYRQGKIMYKPQNKLVSLIDQSYAFSVYRDKRMVLSRSSKHDRLWLGFAYNCKPSSPLRSFNGGVNDFISEKTKLGSNPFVDLNNDGVPDLIVVQQEAMRSFTYTVFSLDTKVKQLGIIRDHWMFSWFMDINGDGKYEALARDKSFLGWEECIARSPTPFVILKLSKNGFELDTRLMKTSRANKQGQEKMLADWQKSCSMHRSCSPQSSSKIEKDCFFLDSSVWSDMLNLIYSGNSKQALELLDKFWSNDKYAMNLEYAEGKDYVRTSKERFKRLFLEQLKKSPYMVGLKRLNPYDGFLQEQSSNNCTDAVLIIRKRPGVSASGGSR